MRPRLLFKLLFTLGAVLSLVGITLLTTPAAHAKTAAPAVHVVNIDKVVNVTGVSRALRAAPDIMRSGYSFNQVIGIALRANSDVTFQIYTSISSAQNQIWVNGAPTCISDNGGLVTWCGVASGNGTYQLDTGLNYQKYDSNGVLWKYYLRYHLAANSSCYVNQGSFNGYYGLICRGG